MARRGGRRAARLVPWPGVRPRARRRARRLVEPGGRLPVTWPADELGLPGTTPVDGLLVYSEGLLVGHRAYDRSGRVPAYRFGHGLGYTSWSLDRADSSSTPDAGARITVALRNTGNRAGSEVVQVYASRPGSSVERPDRWLAGFARVHAAPGEAVEAVVTIAPRAFEHWEPGTGWVREAGTFDLHAGRSSGDLTLTTSVDLPGVGRNQH